jgi:hypothetical protein
MKLGSETGSVINHLLACSIGQPEAEVGMGATVCYWTDRHAATIVKVTKCTIHVQEDIATRTDDLGMGDSQSYSYSPDRSAPVIIFRKTKRGWKAGGMSLLIGVRDHHYDYSF